MNKGSAKIQINLRQAEAAAVRAAREVGVLLRRSLHLSKSAHEVTQHDIKLDLDVRSQRMIEKSLHAAFPQAALVGEEGSVGKREADARWVVDPIDGTVNFAYGIPHACVSIALQGRSGRAPCPHRAAARSNQIACAMRTSRPTAQGNRAATVYPDGFETLLGVVYDPFCDELWTAIAGEPARLNGKAIHVSRRRKLQEAVVSIGFAKTRKNLRATLPYFTKLIHRVRKVRIMGSAALALTYVATGRFDAYIERGIRLWDIAAGGLIVECAGGEFWREAVPGQHAYRMIASNGLLRKRLSMPY